MRAAGTPADPSAPALHRGAIGLRVAAGVLLAAILALAWWGYRRPELFLDLVRMPFC